MAETIKELCEQAVKETNRIVYKWLDLHKSDARFTITEQDVRSVFNGWMIRFLKSTLGYSETSKFLRYHRITITLSRDLYVDKISTYELSYAKGSNDSAERLKEIFKSLDYPSLRYSQEENQERERESQHLKNLLRGQFDPTVDIDFTNLKNIQFV